MTTLQIYTFYLNIDMVTVWTALCPPHIAPGSMTESRADDRGGHSETHKHVPETTPGLLLVACVVFWKYSRPVLEVFDLEILGTFGSRGA